MISCSKDVPTSSTEARTSSTVESLYIPPIVDTRRDYRTQDLLALADYFSKESVNREVASLSPTDFKYALETLRNRDLNAGKNAGSEQESHPLLFDYVLNESGEIDGSQFESFYTQIIEQVDYLQSLGAQFHIVDIEIVEGNRILADIITVVGYVNTDLSFGFGLLPSGSYQVLSNSFKNYVNDRIFVEALNEDEFFFTDIYPNPSSTPSGLTLSAFQVMGNLGNGCAMHAGTLEIHGGPELVYGNNNLNIWMSAADANTYLMKGINHIESLVPPWDGMQLIRLNFTYVTNSQAEEDPCLPNNFCNWYYPCFVRTHAWNRGFVARKMAVEK